ncbi:trehalase-like domain-containing protein, partial [Streptomyces sp. NPDC005568]|uniref:trehalase-like domain-containing protein n=1 Tax=Streptomyces sp. NPDC005568 TaxID=3156887 RepID=UPI0033B42A2A
MNDYPLIEDHGLIGDLQTAALVTTDGTIDWFCCPRFDSPSVFGALLDHGKGGHFSVRPAARTYTTKQLYHPDTAVLVTRFMTEDGAGEVVDFMPVTGTTVTDRHRIVRMLRCVRGSMTFEGEVAPRFDYGRKPHEVHLTEHGAVFTSDELDLAVHTVREPQDERLLHNISVHDSDVRFSLTLRGAAACRPWRATT